MDIFSIFFIKSPVCASHRYSASAPDQVHCNNSTLLFILSPKNNFFALKIFPIFTFISKYFPCLHIDQSRSGQCSRHLRPPGKPESTQAISLYMNPQNQYFTTQSANYLLQNWNECNSYHDRLPISVGLFVNIVDGSGTIVADGVVVPGGDGSRYNHLISSIMR